MHMRFATITSTMRRSFSRQGVSILAVTAMLALASNAHSQSSVVIAIDNPHETDKIVNDPIVASTSLTLPDSSAFGYANLDTGVLRSSAIGPFAQANSGFSAQNYSSQSAAQIADSITFASGLSGIGYLDWQFDGTLSPFEAPVHSATAALVLNVGTFGETIYLTDNPGFCSPNQPLCTTGTSIDQSGSIPFQLNAGSFHISAFLQTVAFDGASADFSNTGKLFLRLPTGVTYSSTSGVFLADAAQNVPAVPEPATYAFILFGLVCAGYAVRKSRSTAA